MSRFVRDVDFSSLSAKDLLEARDHYHVHLSNLENVVGTAIGRYRIRYTDPDYKSPYAQKNYNDPTPRQLNNSGVRAWSWPCVLVFVSDWDPREEFAKKPAQFVPPRLYLPDGRVAPTCVIYAPRKLEGPPPIEQLSFPTGMVGGGYPILTDDQNQQRVGSIGCLVTDGSYTYALTNRHVVGKKGTPAYIFQGGDRHTIAQSHTKAEGKVLLQDIYPGWPGTRSLINIDAGLFTVDDISEWTAQVIGIGRIGELIDLNVDTLNLDLIGCPVRANGGVSGQLRGEIQGLFYRYRSVGGFDYMADLLIGPRRGDDTVTTRPGDSGTVWFWDAEADRPVPIDTQPADLKAEQTATAPHEPATEINPPGREQAFKTPELRPIGLQWGGHSFLEPGGQGVMQFALASSLSHVCRLLDVELVRDWNIDHSLYWGRVGHYKIAFSACFRASNPRLARLLSANAENISVSDVDISNGNLPTGAGRAFVALADVADLVWRNTRKMDEANHFADMDQPGGPNEDQPTLMDLWMNDPESRTPDRWTEFYDNLPEPPEDKHRGALPFRVRQIYEAMVEALQNREAESFVCAAGVLAHYVGDACQPLHVSRFHHGHPGHQEETDVHSFYETKMLDQFAPDVVAKVNDALGERRAASSFQGGAAAAERVVRLMRETINRLSPETVVNTWLETAGNHHTRDLWNALGDDTAACMAEGVLCLADIWESAWIEGDGDHQIGAASLDRTLDHRVLQRLYRDRSFVESKWLKNMSF